MPVSEAEQARITEMQRRLRPVFITPYGEAMEPWHPPLVFNARRHMEDLRANLRRKARWWELEAMRGYVGVVEDGLTSSDRSRQYAANMRWLVELLDNGHSVEAGARGTYVDGMLASEYMARARKQAPGPRTSSPTRRRHQRRRRRSITA